MLEKYFSAPKTLRRLRVLQAEVRSGFPVAVFRGRTGYRQHVNRQQAGPQGVRDS